jgi:hypothetical protein
LERGDSRYKMCRYGSGWVFSSSIRAFERHETRRRHQLDPLLDSGLLSGAARYGPEASMGSIETLTTSPQVVVQ